MLAEAARLESQRDVGRVRDALASRRRCTDADAVDFQGISSFALTTRRDPTVLAGVEHRLKDYHDQFKVLAREVVVALGSSPDLDMRFLSVRENFNSHYCTSSF